MGYIYVSNNKFQINDFISQLYIFDDLVKPLQWYIRLFICCYNFSSYNFICCMEMGNSVDSVIPVDKVSQPADYEIYGMTSWKWHGKIHFRNYTI